MCKVLSKERQELKNKVEKLGIVDWNLFNARIRIGWNEKDAMTIPTGTCYKNSEFYQKNGMLVKEYCKLHNIEDHYLFASRIARGYDYEVAANTPKLSGVFARKGAKCKHTVFYKGKSMKLTVAMKMLCEELEVWGEGKVSSVYCRARAKKQTIQQSFDHFVKLYHKKYERN